MQWEKQKNGFTIVELLIVIVVIAILAAITVVAYNGIQERAWNSRAVANANTMQKVLMAYQSEHGRYPDYSGIAGNEQVCLGGGYPDKNSDGIGDCVVAADGTVRASQIPVADDPLVGLAGSQPALGDGPYLQRPRSSPDNQYFVISGVRYAYMANTYYNDILNPDWLVYIIRGVGTDCRRPVALAVVSGSNRFTSVSESVMKNDAWKECYEPLPPSSGSP